MPALLLRCAAGGRRLLAGFLPAPLANHFFTVRPRSLLLVAVLCALLTGGCAHGPAPASPPASLAGTPRLAAAHAGAATYPAAPAGGSFTRQETPAGVPSAPGAAPGKTSPVDTAAPAPASTSPSGLAVDVASGGKTPPPALAAMPPGAAASGNDLDEEYGDDDTEAGDAEKDHQEEAAAIDDPLEPFNRAMFIFNDRLYFWVLKPVSQGYNFAVPEDVRISIRNVFRNVAFPVRFVNCLLQANLTCAGTEVGRFLVNSTFGFGGMFDVAAGEPFNLVRQPRELGETLGVYGWESSVYVNWPFIGPSSPRDTIGLTGDVLLDPLAWLQPWYLSLGVAAYYKLNNVSLSIGDYEALKAAAIDPYVAVRDAYIQHRRNIIKKAKQNQAMTPVPPDKK